MTGLLTDPYAWFGQNLEFLKKCFAKNGQIFFTKTQIKELEEKFNITKADIESLLGFKIEVRDPNELKEGDEAILVCVPYDGKNLLVPDNETALCSWCSTPIQLRPNASHIKIKICRSCMNGKLEAQ